MKTTNKLEEFRKKRGLSASYLAGEAGVSRQTIYAIESGDYVPNTTVALKMARTLKVNVEDLFFLADLGPVQQASSVDLIRLHMPSTNASAYVARVGDKRVAVPLPIMPVFLPTADAVLSESGRKAIMLDDSSADKTLLIAGCDPAVSLLADELLRNSGITLVAVPCSSTEALGLLRAGKVHIAGMHLRDGKSGDYNLPQIRRGLRGRAHTVVTFAVWQQGILAAPGNPKRIRRVEDLLRRNVTIINREAGAGARQLLDTAAEQAGADASRIAGYGNTAYAHMQAAVAVASGEADCCIATNSAARALGLEFIPIASERYDFVIANELADPVAINGLLDVMQRAALRRKLEMLAGYETGSTGKIQVE